MDKTFSVSVSPHVKDKDSVKSIMWWVNGALLIPLGFGIYYFGFRAFLLSLLAVLGAVATEYVIQKIGKRPVRISDGSAVITGLLIAYNIPATAPLWLPVIGSVFAIFIVKEVFGGIGYNILNPALTGRAFLLASWPVEMTASWSAPAGGTISGLTSQIEALTSATPLNLAKQSAKILADPNAFDPQLVENAKNALEMMSSNYLNLLWGNIGGCIGETSVIAILIGAAILLFKKIITWHIPVVYIGTVALLTAIFGENLLFWENSLFHVLSGGLMLGAFFMATDMVTSPITKTGQIIFAVGIGIFTVVIRLWGGYPEGVSYSILLMNLVVPLINRYAKPKIFGEVKNG
ncbi:MAG: RnfABCDGE type electron transport complex subunit D [Calditrichia bacterium]|nr:RnfABCDGE type electron transport complex subunit D [Calditrichia bacterium]